MLWTRNYPVVMAGGVAVLLFSLVGAAAITGALPGADREKNAAAALRGAKSARNSACSNCGVVAEVRPIGARDIVYRVILRMDDGSERIVSQSAEPPFGVGARVRLNGRVLERG